MQVTIETVCHPTEALEKVQRSIVALFPDAAFEDGADRVVARTSDVAPIRQRIWELKIIDAARGAILPGVRGDEVRFRLLKQAALQGHVSFPPDAREHGLGDLWVRVVLDDADPWDDATHWVWWLCPPTEEGAIVGDPERPKIPERDP